MRFAITAWSVLFAAILLNPGFAYSQDSLPKVIVTPFKNSTGLELQSIDSVTDTFISLLGQSKRFVVLEREAIDKITAEKVASGDFAVEGADYAFICNLATLDLKQSTFKIPVINVEKEKVAVKISVNVRVVEIKSSKVLFAANAESKREKEGVQGEVFLQVKRGGTELDNAMVNDAMKEALAELVTNITNNLFPIKVLAIKDGKVYINRGGPSGIKNGMVFKVYRQEEALVDEDTGLNLGSAETEIGTIRVTETQDKFSVATIVDGALDASAKGSICRVPQIAAEQKAGEADKKEKKKFSF